MTATEPVREATIEECAKILDGCAQDWNRIRDPGMANNAQAYARKIRSLTTEPKPSDPGRLVPHHGSGPATVSRKR